MRIYAADTRSRSRRSHPGHFRRIPAGFCCDACGHAYAPAAEVLACPACGSLQVRLTAGDELYLEALEVGQTDPLTEPEKEPVP